MNAKGRVASASMAREWASYRELCVPADARETQVVETRRAFYAGAWAVFGVMVDIEDPEVDEETAVKALGGMSDECVEVYVEAKAEAERKRRS